MDTTDPLYQETCFRCERPALTFDAQYRALCGRHATIFVTAPRLTSKDDELVALSSADDYTRLRGSFRARAGVHEDTGEFVG